jgi:hypothetical protein
MTAFVLLGSAALLGGLAVLVTGLRAPTAAPRRAAMLIGGMMLTAFGLVLAGFAIAYQTAAPLDLNEGTAQ